MAVKFKFHPVLKSVKISNCGSIVMQYNKKCRIKEFCTKPKHPLMLVKINHEYISLPRLVLETYKGLPKKGKVSFAKCVDGNHKNTHPDNLIWKPHKLSEAQEIYCHTTYHKKTEVTLKMLAEKFNVSDMTILRAIRRVEELLKQKKLCL